MECLISLLLLVLSFPLARALPASESPTTTVPFQPPIQRQQPPVAIHPTDAIFREQPAPESSSSAVAVVVPAQLPPIPLPPPLVTPPPTHDAALAEHGYTQVTYYTCRTARDGGAEQCGWHVPVRKVEGGAASIQRVDVRVVVAAVGGVAGLFVLGLL